MSGSEKQRRVPVRGPRIRGVPAVSRAIAILRLLGRTSEPMSLSAISDALAIIPSTALHILRVLVAEGLVKFEPDSKRYGLDSGMLVLARSVIERSGFAMLVQPVLDRVAQEWGTTMMGVEIQRDE
ncbi:MAG: helix-turn-helix domain-containing protein, partial [Niabella sp.]